MTRLAGADASDDGCGEVAGATVEARITLVGTPSKRAPSTTRTSVRVSPESPKTCPGTSVDKPKLLEEIGAALAARGAGPGASRAVGATTGAKGSAKKADTLPIPLEYLVSRDVADPVGPPAADYDDHEVREDRAAARAITEEAAVRADASADVTTILSRTNNEWRELRPYVVNLSGRIGRGHPPVHARPARGKHKLTKTR